MSSFLTWMKRRYSTLRLPTIVIRTGSNQTWNGRFVANAAMTLSSMPDTARATLTTRITKRNTGFQGKSEHDIIYIRELCKNFIADSYVFDYEKALRGLQKRKAMSDWFLASGYTGDYEGKQEYKRSIVVDELD